MTLWLISPCCVSLRTGSVPTCVGRASCAHSNGIFGLPSFGHLLGKEGHAAALSQRCSRCMNQTAVGWSFSPWHTGIFSCALGGSLQGFPATLLGFGAPHCRFPAAFASSAERGSVGKGRGEQPNPLWLLIQKQFAVSSLGGVEAPIWEGNRGGSCAQGIHTGAVCVPLLPAWLFPVLPSVC